MNKLIGQTVANYKIIEQIGQGGMGVVFKAEDTILKRFVALKFLPLELTRDEEARERFIKEAQSASALDHTNICTIHEIKKTEDGQMFIVMNFYEGDTLKDKIASKKGAKTLHVNEVTDIAIQIARGLAKAHEKGIVHRDIKPANIFITTDGVVKILDFGVAKLSGHTKLTKTHVTIGTVAYMSTEQVGGEEVDQRTDIWSLGAVLYEMVTGKAPFRGEYEQAVIYSILNNQPEPITKSEADQALAGLEKVILKCLQKKKEDRYETAEELLIDLDTGSILKSEKHKRTEEKLKESIKIVRFGFIIILLLLSFIIFFQSGFFQKKVAKPNVANVRSLTNTSSIFETGTSISPDGMSVSYSSDESGNMDLWVHQITSGQKINLTEDYTGMDNGGIWSPDGGSLAFISSRDNGGVYVVSQYGGIARQVVKEDYKNLRWFCWSPDVKKLAFTIDEILYIVPVSGGTPQKISLPHRCMFLDWSSATNRIIYSLGYPNRYSQIWTVKPDGSDLKILLKGPGPYQFPTWSQDGRYVFYKSMRGGTRDIWWVEVDKDGNAKNKPEQLTTGANAYDLSISYDGKKMAYMQGGYEFNIWALPLNANRILTIKDARQITTEKHQITSLKISKDNEWFAFSLIRSGGIQWEIWVMRKNGQDLKQVMVDSTGLGVINWSPDGNYLTFQANRKENHGIYIVPVNGGLPTAIATSPANDFSPSWSPDGKEIVFYSDRNGNFDIWAVTVANGELRQITRDSTDEGHPCWSPDGRFISYISNKTGDWEIYKIPAQGGKSVKLTNIKSKEADIKSWKMMDPIWSSANNLIYSTYIASDNDPSRKIISVSPIDGTTKTIYEYKTGNLQGEPSSSLTTDGKNLYFIPKFHQGDIWLADLVYE